MIQTNAVTLRVGNQRLYEVMKEKDAIYAKEDFPMRTAFATAYTARTTIR